MQVGSGYPLYVNYQQQALANQNLQSPIAQVFLFIHAWLKPVPEAEDRGALSDTIVSLVSDFASHSVGRCLELEYLEGLRACLYFSCSGDNSDIHTVKLALAVHIFSLLITCVWISGTTVELGASQPSSWHFWHWHNWHLWKPLWIQSSFHPLGVLPNQVLTER